MSQSGPRTLVAALPLGDKRGGITSSVNFETFSYIDDARVRTRERERKCERGGKREGGRGQGDKDKGLAPVRQQQ